MLIDALQNVIKKHQQAIVFLNRRGFSTYMNCKRCGFVLKCKRCDAILVYHFDKKSLICHYCNSKLSPPNICPKCKSGYIRYFGIGTEKVESELSRLIPQARISRMDTDATAKRGSHHRILEDFKRHNVDILVGTQMIAKGLDFPKVTLVGVVNADVTLNLPDFRASERTFNLITQVAGRAGRGKEGGEVIVQTYAPHHYALLNASKHDYEKFFELEIKSRKDLKFPPFYYLIRITLRSRNESKTQKAAMNLASVLKKNLKDIEVTGPAPAPIARVRGYYRWNILLKSKNRSIMSFSLKKVLGRIRKPSGVLMAVDVDPISV
jgi:primosomal protein N' (replication factor Y)